MRIYLKFSVGLGEKVEEVGYEVDFFEFAGFG